MSVRRKVKLPKETMERRSKQFMKDRNAKLKKQCLDAAKKQLKTIACHEHFKQRAIRSNEKAKKKKEIDGMEEDFEKNPTEMTKEIFDSITKPVVWFFQILKHQNMRQKSKEQVAALVAKLESFYIHEDPMDLRWFLKYLLYIETETHPDSIDLVKTVAPYLPPLFVFYNYGLKDPQDYFHMMAAIMTKTKMENLELLLSYEKLLLIKEKVYKRHYLEKRKKEKAHLSPTSVTTIEEISSERKSPTLFATPTPKTTVEKEWELLRAMRETHINDRKVYDTKRKNWLTSKRA